MLLALLAAVADLTAFTARTQPSIVLLESLDSMGHVRGSGTGFFISSDGRIATNHHVIAHADRMRATLWSGHKLEVMGVLADDPEHDLAIVKVEDSGFAPLPLGAALHLHPGVPIAIVGHPLGMGASIADGTIAAVQKRMPADTLDVKGEVVQVNAIIAHGNSGSPLQTMDGVVVAVLFARVDGLPFAIPAERLRELVARLPPAARLSGFAGSAGNARNWLISAALAAAGLLAFAALRVVRARNTARRVASAAVLSMRR